jgi:predicted RNase H-like HicB family nuclease
MLKPRDRKFTAILEPAEEGGYIAKCVELPVTTEGETKAEVVRNIKEAVEGYLEVRAGLLGKSKAKKQLVEIAVKQASGPLVA